MKTKTQIEWRRAKVLELLAQGHSQVEIARQLQVPKDIVSRDVKFMRHEALENMRDYTTKQLPLQLKMFISALQNSIATYWRLSQEAKDDHDKLDATELYLEAHTSLWALLSGAESIERLMFNPKNKQLEVVKLKQDMT